jgi:hypothetical protein
MGGEVRLESDARPTVFTLDLPWSEETTPRPFSRENAPRDLHRVGSD